MSEMIERVAMAMLPHYQGVEDLRVLARAAIEAMREPTEAMMAERSQTEINGYRAMIDEALE